MVGFCVVVEDEFVVIVDGEEIIDVCWFICVEIVFVFVGDGLVGLLGFVFIVRVLIVDWYEGSV